MHIFEMTHDSFRRCRYIIRDPEPAIHSKMLCHPRDVTDGEGCTTGSIYHMILCGQDTL